MDLVQGQMNNRATKWSYVCTECSRTIMTRPTSKKVAAERLRKHIQAHILGPCPTCNTIGTNDDNVCSDGYHKRV
jgi:DNA-directed RNA polymerase subunit RPC12/RpoP